ncbi:hypothetical protein BHE97_00130 [Aeromicrobium sp. PE09-221]|nr:hypothetical protein BHE97_00130 [Aeromicrobium sp. PE09-221]
MTAAAHSSRGGNATPTEAHEHGWIEDSRHPTSAGFVLYVRCIGCGTRRVDLQERDTLPPRALSTEVPPPGGRHLGYRLW